MLGNAVGIRLELFSKIYLKELDFDEAMKWRYLSDCYDYVTRMCDKDDLFSHLKNFERMFATCAFVLNLCIRINQHSHLDVVNYGYIIWAMYFDKFTETFYDEGGWNELRRVAKIYQNLSGIWYLKCETSITASLLQVLKEASVNYIQFRKAIKCDIFKHKQKGTIHISKPWVQFHTERFKEYVRIPPSYENTMSTLKIELLMHLKIIFNFPTDEDNVFEILQNEFQGMLSTIGIPYSTPFNSCFESKIFDDQIQNPTISNMLCKFPNDRKNLDMQIHGEFLTSSENNVFNETIDNTENFGYSKKSSFKLGILGRKSSDNLDEYSHKGCNNIQNTSMNPRLESSIKNSTNACNLNLNRKFSAFNSTDEDLRETSSRNVNRWSDVMTTANNLTTNQNEELECSKNTLPRNLLNTMDLCFESQLVESLDTRELSKSPLDSSFSDKNEDVCNENIEITHALSTNPMAVTNSERNTIPKNLCTSKDSLAVNEVTSNSDGKIIMNKELVKLREQNDFGIKKFLRMILILGDKQGIHYVRETLSCNEKYCEYLQGKSSKRKKRTKKSRK